MWLWTISRVTYSNTLPVVDKKVIGRKFLEEFRALIQRSDASRSLSAALFSRTADAVRTSLPVSQICRPLRQFVLMLRILQIEM
jgi:hypothetical protein